MSSAVELTNRAVGLVNEDPAQARRLLGEALAADFSYEPAWAWFAAVTTDRAERKFCLQRACEYRPDAETRRALAELDEVSAQAPPEIAGFLEPERPTLSTPPDRGPDRRRLRWIGAGAVTLLVAGVVFFAAGGARRSPVYIAVAAGISSGVHDRAVSMVNSVQMQLDEINAKGGVQGRPVELLVFDDHNDAAEAKRQAEAVVADGRIQLVIGHMVSDTAAAAAPVYAKAGIPAITPSATSDSITESSRWYFRSVFGSKDEGRFQATYLATVLGATTASVVWGSDVSGQQSRDPFVDTFRQFGEIQQDLRIDFDPARIDASIAEAVARLKAQQNPGPIIVALPALRAEKFVVALRAAGIETPIFGTDALGSTGFHDQLTNSAWGREHPAEIVRNMYGVSPLPLDSLSGSALAWANRYRKRFDINPTWFTATAHEATELALHAMADDRVDLSGKDSRSQIREALAAIDSPKHSIPGLLAPLYFEAAGGAHFPISVVRSNGKQYESAPVQLADYTSTPGATVAQDLTDGRAIAAGGKLFARRQVVSTGLNLNEISGLDTRAGTFFADFYLWLRYTGDDGVSDVEFVNAANPNLKLGAPIRTSTVDGETYRLYRVADRFKADLDFRHFPFDRQRLPILLQNRSLPDTRVVYVTDRTILEQSEDKYLLSGANSEASINKVANWRATSVAFFQQTVGSSDSLGDPNIDQAAQGIFNSQYATQIEISRDLGPFLLKNLLPLALLMCVTYLALYIPAAEGGATSMGVTAILSTAVLLNTVTSGLGDISYTVALEWGYYAFIMLATGVVLVALVRKNLHSAKKTVQLRRLTLGARIAYPLYVAGVAITYCLLYAG
ncbi:hypothetical protein D5S17_28030 [Pseudonocardiaceae bacterium YIM PH 21723]|nr:hypothetical protein D5S17_28030 [Pseudonocardiaceae bacterium YIM PH 21723]